MTARFRRAVTARLALALVLVSTSARAGDGIQPLADVEQVAREYIARLNGMDPTGVEVGPMDRRLRLPVCEVALAAFLPQGSRTTGQTTAGVRCPGGQSWSVFVPVTVRTAVAPGAPLRTATVPGPRVVRRGDAVTLVVEAPGIEVRAAGTALGEGAVGDTVRVRNTLNKKEVEGVVTSPATVQVRM